MNSGENKFPKCFSKKKKKNLKCFWPVLPTSPFKVEGKWYRSHAPINSPNFDLIFLLSSDSFIGNRKFSSLPKHISVYAALLPFLYFIWYLINCFIFVHSCQKDSKHKILLYLSSYFLVARVCLKVNLFLSEIFLSQRAKTNYKDDRITVQVTYY